MAKPLADRVRFERRSDLLVRTAPTWESLGDETWNADDDDWDPSDDGPSDGAGNSQGDWSIIGPPIVRAEVRELNGDEAVLAGKLEGVAAVVVFVRACELTRGLTTDDRVIDLASNRTLNIRHVPREPRARFLAILCEAGVAT